ncbi:hypothetical protein NDN08_006347 [Rhodosorus marinus]|uniref:glutathione gamma-glutamylcysteinyltransferase n=1 Tax=Rhodosorus marinus TaxID=101924 RepID=A0AAV8UNZ1_9RHOD|nr:hypothetical protein NDN08_006347 [Rhodosorus marinus]
MRWCLISLVVLVLVGSGCGKPDLVPLLSDEGMKLLDGSGGSGREYVELSANLQTQVNQAFCGVATTATLLNMLEVRNRPVDESYEPYQFFTQKDIFEVDCVRAVNAHGNPSGMDYDYVLHHGLSLEQVAGMLACFANVTVYRPSSFSVHAFRETVKDSLQKGAGIAVNVDRYTLQQVGGGHFSPIAAFNEKLDMMLFMDVARYKYSPAWIPVKNLYDAMNTVDPSEDAERGWIVAQRPPNAKPKKVVGQLDLSEGAASVGGEFDAGQRRPGFVPILVGPTIAVVLVASVAAAMRKRRQVYREIDNI